MKRIIVKICNDHLFLIIFSSLFILINMGYYYCLLLPFHLSVLLYAWILEYIAFGLSYEATEIILSVLLKKTNLPRLERIENYPRVALICCTCDDVDMRILSELGNQTYPNLDIFILDDSKSKEARAAVDSLKFKIIRRENRIGYKAGNINNWLFRYGYTYEYFVIADADSVFPEEFIEEMILYADNPKNCKIAVFESLIHAWNTENKFVYYQSIMTNLSDQIRLHVENRFGMSLSVGHNNLLRTKVLIECGGFEENFLAEDYATILKVIKNNAWFCKTVPVMSYERLPENLNEYTKRQARWAYQTFQLNTLDLTGIPGYVRLRILGSLHYYCAPFVAIIGLLLIGFFIIQQSIEVEFSKEIFLFIIDRKIITFWISYLILPFIFRLSIMVYIGVSVIEYLEGAFFHGALFVATIWPVLVRVSRFWSATSRTFDVTGSCSAPSFQQIVFIGWPVYAMLWLTLLFGFWNPFLIGLNLLWIVPSCISPFIIAFYQGSKS